MSQNNTIDVAYDISKDIHDKQFLLALVQKTASSKVKAGENAGSLLNHVNIVKTLKTIAIDGHGSGHVKLQVPDGIKAQELEAIGFLQSMDGKIHAAAAINNVK